MKALIKKIAKKLKKNHKKISEATQPKLEDKTLDISGISLVINLSDNGGRLYQARQSVEEVENQLYPRLAEMLNPEIIIDVGANYGFTASIFAKHFHRAELILIEPDPKLSDYIIRNMHLNGITGYRLIQSICSNQTAHSVPFGINPAGSQDNRVMPLAGWNTIAVSSVTLNELLSSKQKKPAFIKIDTQGFETQVFMGAEEYLLSSNNWFIKSEFAPFCLESQNNSPVQLLEYLVARYLVVEAPARTRYHRDSLVDLFKSPLKSDEITPFVNHVKSLNSSDKGWVDLYIMPKTYIKS